MKKTELTKIQYCRKETKDESESSSKKPSQKNNENAVKQKDTKVHCVFFVCVLTTVCASLYAAACIFFYPISKDHLCIVTFGLMYGLYSRAASNQERPMMARVR